MKKSLTIVFAVLTIIAAKAQNPKGVELAVADMRIHATFYSPDMVRVTKVPVGSDAVFTLYEDEGDNYNYERSMYSTIPMKWDDKARMLTIGDCQGKFEGMLQKRTFKIRLAGTEIVRPVRYEGKSVSVSMK